MELHWLRLAKPCTLELPSDVTDYAGQRLIFRPKQLTRRCVTKEVYDHPLVQRYLETRLLEEEGAESRPDPTPAPTPETTPEPEPAPEPALEPEPAPDPEPPKEEEKAAATESKPKRRRRRNK